MESLFRFLLRHHVFLAFLVLESLSLTLLYNSSDYQQSKIMARLDAIKGGIYSVTGEWANYFRLRAVNDDLAHENNLLLNELVKYRAIDTLKNGAVWDTFGHKLYNYVPATIKNNTTNTQNNYLIIDKGSDQGIFPEMGVISAEGVVGITTRVLKNHAAVMSLLNTDCHISAKLKRTGHFGPLTWSGNKLNEALLVEVPQHAPVQVGDTVVTSGYTSIFPEGIMLGTVESFEIKKGSFYEIKVALSVDFKSVHYVNVIRMDTTARNEIDKLEKKPAFR